MISRSPSDQNSARPFLPAKLTLMNLRQAAHTCRGCDLYINATQAVFSEGPKSARLMLVGEQPGDQEDLQGRPFVGPAGRMLDAALEDVGIHREDVYLTNSVKHFKFTPRGKRRIHSKPNAREVRACRPWLEAEMQVVKPKMVVALGATAAQTLYGPSFRVSTQRGQVFGSEWAAWNMATVHPSSLIRAPDEDARRAAWEAFVDDFRVVAKQYRLVMARA
jgi:uracil-DNA glycosylase